MAVKAHPQMEEFQEEPWYADSGANNHITSALENLQVQEPYKGNEEVVAGNGSGLLIKSTGSSTLFHQNKTFHMKNVLHYPSAAKNLFFIQKFCLDNH